MRNIKLFSILAVAALLLTPATAMARTHFTFSLNLIDCMRPVLMPQPRPVVIVPAPPPVYYYYPYYPRAPYPQRTIVKEYHYYHHAQEEPVEELKAPRPYPKHPRR